MNIVEALKGDNSLRLSGTRDRWMCGDETGLWTVYERKPYAKRTTVVIETENEDEAVKALLNEDEGEE